MVDHFDEASRFVRPEDMRDAVLISSDPGRFAQWIAEAADIGFEEVNLHHVGQEQRPFIEAFGRDVLPQLT
jgi:alkanesulfonate monooxygenase SsuD/methylene tetrahydromethanopterin reductase-like flavin-dependent oxidoreductase (luciferase family)